MLVGDEVFCACVHCLRLSYSSYRFYVVYFLMEGDLKYIYENLAVVLNKPGSKHKLAMNHHQANLGLF